MKIRSFGFPGKMESLVGLELSSSLHLWWGMALPRSSPHTSYFLIPPSFICITCTSLLACEFATLVLWFQGLMMCLFTSKGPWELLRSFCLIAWSTCRSINIRLETGSSLLFPKQAAAVSAALLGPLKLSSYIPSGTEIPMVKKKKNLDWVKLGYTGVWQTHDFQKGIRTLEYAKSFQILYRYCTLS